MRDLEAKRIEDLEHTHIDANIQYYYSRVTHCVKWRVVGKDYCATLTA